MGGSWWRAAAHLCGLLSALPLALQFIDLLLELRDARRLLADLPLQLGMCRGSVRRGGSRCAGRRLCCVLRLTCSVTLRRGARRLRVRLRNLPGTSLGDADRNVALRMAREQPRHLVVLHRHRLRELHSALSGTMPDTHTSLET